MHSPVPRMELHTSATLLNSAHRLLAIPRVSMSALQLHASQTQAKLLLVNKNCLCGQKFLHHHRCRFQLHNSQQLGYMYPVLVHLLVAHTVSLFHRNGVTRCAAFARLLVSFCCVTFPLKFNITRMDEIVCLYLLLCYVGRCCSCNFRWICWGLALR